MEIFYSTGAFESQSPLAISEECKSLGVGMELTSSFAPNEQLMKEVMDLDMMDGSLLVHNYFPPPPEPFVLNLAATDPNILSASLAHCRRAMNLCAAKSVAFYSVHAGFAMNLSPAQLGQPEQQAALGQGFLIPIEKARGIFRESVLELADFAKGLGLRLLLENNVITPVQAAAGRAETLLLTHPDEARRFFDELQHPAVGFLLDVAHAKVAGRALAFDPMDFLRLLEVHLTAFHLSDNDGMRDNNQMFSREAWFLPALKSFGAMPKVIEVYRLSCEQRRAQLEILSDFVQ
jgi:sugar phosphate isomerase/epimerase